MLTFAETLPAWYTQWPWGTLSQGPKTVAGRLRGKKAFRGAGSTVTMALVPKGSVGTGECPASAQYSCAAASTAMPHHLVGIRVPIKRYLARRFSWPTADSAEPLLLGSYPWVVVCMMP